MGVYLVVVGCVVALIALMVIGGAAIDAWIEHPMSPRAWALSAAFVLGLAGGITLIGNITQNDPPCLRYTTTIISGHPYRTCTERAEPIGEPQ